MPEEVVYQRGNIEITKALARFGSVTYPINGIGSVFVTRPRRAELYFAATICLALAVVLWSGGGAEAGALFALVGIASALIGWTRKSRLVLRTASGDQNALESRSQSELQEIKRAIETAVTLRGLGESSNEDA